MELNPQMGGHGADGSRFAAAAVATQFRRRRSGTVANQHVIAGAVARIQLEILERQLVVSHRNKEKKNQ